MYLQPIFVHTLLYSMQFILESFENGDEEEEEKEENIIIGRLPISPHVLSTRLGYITGNISALNLLTPFGYKNSLIPESQWEQSVLCIWYICVGRNTLFDYYDDDLRNDYDNLLLPDEFLRSSGSKNNYHNHHQNLQDDNDNDEDEYLTFNVQNESELLNLYDEEHSYYGHEDSLPVIRDSYCVNDMKSLFMPKHGTIYLHNMILKQNEINIEKNKPILYTPNIITNEPLPWKFENDDDSEYTFVPFQSMALHNQRITTYESAHRLNLCNISHMELTLGFLSYNKYSFFTK